MSARDARGRRSPRVTRRAPRSWSLLLAFAGGTAPQESAPPSPFKLPFPSGASFTCDQGNGGQPTHADDEQRYAFDFAMPLGSPVVACAAGRVIEVKEDGTAGGPGEQFKAQANFVTLDHGGGKYTRYLHLGFGAVGVEEGDLVLQGQKLALSGQTGQVVGPHLHVALCDVWGKSVPLGFADVVGGVPVEKTAYTSKNTDPLAAAANAAKAAPSRWSGKSAKKGSESGGGAAGDAAAHVDPLSLSALPGDAFAFNGVEITSVLPAHVYELDTKYEISGRVTNGDRRVVFFVTPRSGGASDVFFFNWASADGTFILSVRLADKFDKQAVGRFKYALTTMKEDGKFQSAKMLALVLAKK